MSRRVTGQCDYVIYSLEVRCATRGDATAWTCEKKLMLGKCQKKKR